MITVFLARLNDDGKQTLGRLNVFNTQTIKQVFSCYTLEPAWNQNERNASCIPAGSYNVIRHTSPNFGQCFWLQGVPNRSEILIHIGNFRHNTRGCILPGLGLAHLNTDGLRDVTSSAQAMRKLLSVLPERFTLTITE